MLRAPDARLSSSFVAFAALLGALGTSRAAIAQSEPETQPAGGSIAVPTGAAGAVLVAPEAPKEPVAKKKAQMPRALNYKPPRYPAEAAAAGLEGQVTLEIDIDASGHVTRASVVGPAGHGFDEAAVEAANQLEFDPARKADGTPARARILYRYGFTLAPKAPEGEAAADTRQQARAQGLSGFVQIAGSDSFIAGAKITAKSSAGATFAATSDEGGKFDLRPLTPGSYTITIAATGFESLELGERLEPDESLEVKYRLAPAGDLEVVVRGDRPPREVTKRTLERREIDRIPGTNGDALKSLQNLPGVARPPSIAGLLIVRGSAPQETRYYVEGIEVPLVYHFGGLSSVVPTEMLNKIDFYPGNFSTQFGRGTGGIVDVGLRGAKDDGKLHGVVQLDLIDARGVVEGPIPGVSGWNLIAGIRRSWFDAWLGPVLTKVSGGPTQAPVYYDYQVIASHETASSRVRIGFIGSDDALRLLVKTPQPGEPAISGDLTFHTGFERIFGQYEREFSSSDKLTAMVALGRDIVDFGVGPIYFSLASQRIFSRAEYTHRFLRGVTVHTGLDAQELFFDVHARLPTPPRPGEPPNQPFSTRPPVTFTSSGHAAFPALYTEFELTPESRARIVPGLRADYDGFTNAIVVSPRVNARYAIEPSYPKTTIKGGVGAFHQPPQPQQALPPLGNPGLLDSRALHYAAGVEQDITRQLELSFEGFYKQLDHLVIGTPSLSGSGLEYDTSGTGRAYGAELLVKYKPDARFFGWLSYTLSRSTRINGPGQPETLFQFDQTHILTALGSYRLGRGWEFGARLRLISGNLVTPNVCDPAQTSCDPFRANALWNAAGVYTPIPFGAPNSERLPLFQQLDLRIDKRWTFKSFQLSGYLDVQNAYNQANAEAIEYNFNYTARRYVAGLPLIPNLGFRGDF